MLPVVQDAVTNNRKLRMRYRSAGKDPEERVVAPLGLVAKAMTWYLVAQAEAGCGRIACHGSKPLACWTSR